MEITNTITVLKLVWIISTGFGTMFMIALVSKSIGDLHFLQRAKINSLREYSAKTSILTYTGGLLLQSLLFLSGLLSITHDNNLTAASYVTQSILVLISIISSVIAALIFERRNKIMEMIDEHDIELMKSGPKEENISSEM